MFLTQQQMNESKACPTVNICGMCNLTYFVAFVGFVVWLTFLNNLFSVMWIQFTNSNSLLKFKHTKQSKEMCYLTFKDGKIKTSSYLCLKLLALSNTEMALIAMKYCLWKDTFFESISDTQVIQRGSYIKRHIITCFQFSIPSSLHIKNRLVGQSL